MNYLPYWLSFIEGLLSFISPCILPMLPLYFFYLAGVASTDDISRSRLMLNSAAFVTGFSFVFVLLGATATGVGSFLMQNNLWFQRLSGIILVLLGLNFTGIVPIKWLSLDRRLSFDPRQLNFFKSFLFGTVFAFAWTPCVGPLLGAALIMASNVDTIPEGVILLLLYSAGLGIPFLVCAALFERLKSHLLSLQKYSRGITIFSGLVLIFAGVMLFTNQWFYLGG